MGNIKLKPDYIFESSWEVCNKVGGIYTVLSTRAKTLQDASSLLVLIAGRRMSVPISVKRNLSLLSGNGRLESKALPSR